MSAPAIASRIRLPFPKRQAIRNSATTISYGRPGASGVASLRLQLWYGQVADRDHVLSASDVLAAGKLLHHAWEGSERRRSGRALVSKYTVRRLGIERCQSRIEAEPRPAVGTEDRVRLAHIDVDVRVVLRWGHADALEFPHPDADFGDAAVVPELQIAAAGHRLRPTAG